MNKYTVYEIEKYDNLKLNKEDDDVICEYPLTIFLNDIEYATLLCTPEYRRELIVGYLKSDYLINDLDDVESIIIDEDKGLAYVELHDISMLSEELHRKRYITSGCSSSAVFYDTLDAIKLRKNVEENKINMTSVFKIMTLLNQSSDLFRQTGGVHVAGLFDNVSNCFIVEDIGRHNAVDKIVGNMIINKTDPSDKVVAVSGRISSEMILKCAKANINVVISRSAPMDKAIDIARKLNITLIGFVRGKKANIYSASARIEI